MMMMAKIVGPASTPFGVSGAVSIATIWWPSVGADQDILTNQVLEKLRNHTTRAKVYSNETKIGRKIIIMVEVSCM
jgi:hypothetical protein